MSQIETSPGGVGFIRTTAKKSIPSNAPSNGAARRSWLMGKSSTVTKVDAPKTTRTVRNGK